MRGFFRGGQPRIAARVPAEHGPLTEDDALWGAAYRVVFERVGNPHNCKAPEELVVLSQTIADIRAWSRDLEPAHARAYERAAVAVLSEAKTMVENTLRAQRMMTLYATLPKPPESDKSEKAA